MYVRSGESEFILESSKIALTVHRKRPRKTFKIKSTKSKADVKVADRAEKRKKKSFSFNTPEKKKEEEKYQVSMLFYSERVENGKLCTFPQTILCFLLARCIKARSGRKVDKLSASTHIQFLFHRLFTKNES